MRTILISSLFLLMMSFSAITKAQTLHHDISVYVNLERNSIDATDNIRIPDELIKKQHDSLIFTLNADFLITSTNMGNNFSIKEIRDLKKNSSKGVNEKKYYVSGTNKFSQKYLVLKYTGIINGKISANPVDYARGFSETSGIISKDGIYLAGSTKWIPDFGVDLFTFNMNVKIDSAWGVISQGTRTKIETVNDKKISYYDCPYPSDEVYLVAAKWKEYNKKTGDILVQAELRKADTALANKYIDATSKYLSLYNNLIGPYPYSKFTLVENFWETGYGMPSFTLLGEQVIRLPFIINSSYPHELLHNYWGNSVYVDNEKGNWCEGLTVYLADHLFKEQQGQGAEYRRNTLMKFTDFVNEKNDFPVTMFRSRNNSAEEAIGYGKVMMIFEMLRYDIGDDAFKKAISEFYKTYKFKMASFDDIRKSFESIDGINYKPFFEQWVTRK